jgi:Ni/Co efflux regulator RcnB
MKKIRKALALSTLVITLSSGFAFAQDHHEDSHFVRHDEWKKGAKIGHDDWNRGRSIDYHQYHLRAPKKGYEWREVDGNFVLAAVATGLIASTVVASTVH